MRASTSRPDSGPIVFTVFIGWHRREAVLGESWAPGVQREGVEYLHTSQNRLPEEQLLVERDRWAQMVGVIAGVLKTVGNEG